MNESLSVKKRESNFELYRILLMLIILAHHYLTNSGLRNLVNGNHIMTFQNIFLIVFCGWGKVGVNGFVLITGYFMCKKNITSKKFLKLLLEVLFYSITIYLIFLCLGKESFDIKTIISYVFPFTNVSSIFAGCFLLFYLFIPFLNILIKNMNKKQHLLLIALLLFVYTILPSLSFTVHFNYITWFSVLFLIASFVRIYPNEFFDKKMTWGLLTLLFWVLGSVSIVVFYSLHGKVAGDGDLYYFFLVFDSNKILALLTGFSSFMFFKNIHINYSRFINILASATFGVLLLQVTGFPMMEWLWNETLKCPEMYNTPYLYIHAILTPIVLFIIFAFIDIVRQKLIENPIMVLIDKIIEKRKNKKET